jgi:pyruvate dehydrogenase E1 component alpha subunit
MMLIRAFEAALDARPDRGFQLYSCGQEAVAVGVCAPMRPGDPLLTSGRSIGPALARGVDPGAAMAELLGRTAGPNHGKAGRGHLADPAAGFFGAHAVVGGNLSIAAGVALAMQARGGARVTVCIFGDGACGAGALHETLNIAASWKLPLLLVCDNNQLSVATPRAEALAPQRLSDLAAPFGVPGLTVDGMDVEAVREAAGAFLDRARAGEGPAFLECLSERFATHSTATRETRTPEQMAQIRARCPIDRLAEALMQAGLLNAAGRAAVQADVEAVVARALAFAQDAPLPRPEEALTDVG